MLLCVPCLALSLDSLWVLSYLNAVSVVGLIQTCLQDLLKSFGCWTMSCKTIESCNFRRLS